MSGHLCCRGEQKHKTNREWETVESGAGVTDINIQTRAASSRVRSADDAKDVIKPKDLNYAVNQDSHVSCREPGRFFCTRCPRRWPLAPLRFRRRLARIRPAGTARTSRPVPSFPSL